MNKTVFSNAAVSFLEEMNRADNFLNGGPYPPSAVLEVALSHYALTVIEEFLTETEYGILENSTHDVVLSRAAELCKEHRKSNIFSN